LQTLFGVLKNGQHDDLLRRVMLAQETRHYPMVISVYAQAFRPGNREALYPANCLQDFPQILN